MLLRAYSEVDCTSILLLIIPLELHVQAGDDPENVTVVYLATGAECTFSLIPMLFAFRPA